MDPRVCHRFPSVYIGGVFSTSDDCIVDHDAVKWDDTLVQSIHEYGSVYLISGTSSNLFVSPSVAINP
jgi:hypothetical protein